MAWQPSGTAVFVFRGTANRLDATADLKFWRRQVAFLPQSFPGKRVCLAMVCTVLTCPELYWAVWAVLELW